MFLVIFLSLNHLNLEPPSLSWKPVADFEGAPLASCAKFYENYKNSRLYFPWLTSLNLALCILSSFFLRCSSALLSLVFSSCTFSYWSVTLYITSSLGRY